MYLTYILNFTTNKTYFSKMSLGYCTNKKPELGFQYKAESLILQKALLWRRFWDRWYILGINENQGLNEWCRCGKFRAMYIMVDCLFYRRNQALKWNYSVWDTIMRIHSLNKLNKVEDCNTKTLFNLNTSTNFRAHLLFQR